MGRVYEAEHVGLRRTFAIKLLRGDRTGREHLARFRQEAEAASRVGHPSIVEIYDFAQTHDGKVLLIMELLSGESLEDWLSRPGRLAEALPWIAEVARGLHAVHRAGVVHRDVKPANLFLHRDGDRIQPKILDFGIAKVSQTDHTRIETEVGTVLGTPYYLAPERALGRPLDPRADLYSLGVILYELLVGNVPFDDSTFMGIVGKHVKAQPLDPRQAAPERAVPDGVAMLVMALLAKDPAQRPATGAAVAAWIERLLVEERSAIEAHRTGPREFASGPDQATVSLDEVAERPTAAPVDAPTLGGPAWAVPAPSDARGERSVEPPAPRRDETIVVAPHTSLVGGAVPRTHVQTHFASIPGPTPGVVAPASGTRAWVWVASGVGALAGLAVAWALAFAPDRSDAPTEETAAASSTSTALPPEVPAPGAGAPVAPADAPAHAGDVDDKTAPTTPAEPPPRETAATADARVDAPRPDRTERAPARESAPRTAKPRRKTPREQTKHEPSPSGDPRAALPAFKDEVYED